MIRLHRPACIKLNWRSMARGSRFLIDQNERCFPKGAAGCRLKKIPHVGLPNGPLSMSVFVHPALFFIPLFCSFQVSSSPAHPERAVDTTSPSPSMCSAYPPSNDCAPTTLVAFTHSFRILQHTREGRHLAQPTRFEETARQRQQ